MASSKHTHEFTDGDFDREVVQSDADPESASLEVHERASLATERVIRRTGEVRLRRFETLARDLPLTAVPRVAREPKLEVGEERRAQGVARDDVFEVLARLRPRSRVDEVA